MPSTDTRPAHDAPEKVGDPEEIQLPPRDDRNLGKSAAKERDDIRRGRELRHRAQRHGKG